MPKDDGSFPFPEGLPPGIYMVELSIPRPSIVEMLLDLLGSMPPEVRASLSEDVKRDLPSAVAHLEAMREKTRVDQSEVERKMIEMSRLATPRRAPMNRVQALPPDVPTLEVRTESEEESMATKRESELTDAELANVTVAREGTRLIVPEGMSFDVALQALMRKRREEEEDVAVRHLFDMTPPEGALALLRSLQEIHGFVNTRSTPGFFGPKPPTFLSIQTGVGTYEQVPWGRIEIPGIEGFLVPSLEFTKGFPYFCLEGKVKGRDLPKVEKIIQHIKARTDRLYRGKAINLSFPDPNEASGLEDFLPTFVDLPNIPAENLIFSRDISELVESSLFTLIENTEVCRAEGIRLKRGVLLEGPYGVGKTLTATITGLKCIANGWTYIYLRNARDLPKAVTFSRQYQPAVIFVEDIDEVLTQERDEEVNEILNASDGIDTKGLELITVLTTNDVEGITQAMLRPGRLDAVIPMRAPDEEAAGRLIRLFSAGQLAPDQDLTTATKRLAGQIPAAIGEVVERSRLGAIRRKARDAQGRLQITAHDIEVAATGMMAHMKLLEPKTVDARSPNEKAAVVLADALRETAQVKASATSNGSAAGKVSPSNVVVSDAPVASPPVAEG